MSAEDSSSLLAELFGQWEDGLRRGTNISLEKLCQECPQLLEPLRLKVAAATTAPMAVMTPGVSAPSSFDPNRTSIDDSLETMDPVIGLGDDERTLRPDAEFTDLQFIGKGGLGVVYRAVDAQLRRAVAVKFIHRKIAHDAEVRARMRLEAEVTGRLDHPGIVPVHGMGRTNSGRMFYVMRHIDGESFAAAIDDYHSQSPGAEARELEFRNLLLQFASICKTIAYAHDRGILHRDIKPENVMIGRFGETLVVDWGLAVPLDRAFKPIDSGLETLHPGVEISSSNSAEGTPAYMSPEQAIGNLVLTPASDIYSLGATLYRILTSRPPFQGKRLADVLDKVRLGKFTPPSKVRSDVPKPLEAVCLKAMQLDPDARYQRAMELAGDVERWLADAPVSVHPESAAVKWARWGRRNRGAVASGIAALAAFSLMLACVALVAYGFYRKADSAQAENLTMAAEFARGSLQNEIALRWAVLRSAAQDAELQRLLGEQNAQLAKGDAAKDDPRLAELKRVVEKRRREVNQVAPSTVWSLFSEKGRLLVRATEEDLDPTADPSKDPTLKPFSYRDYFHGRGREESPELEYPPLKRPHLSSVYMAMPRNKLVTAFSVPVRASDDAPVIGVLAMVIDCDKLDILPGGGSASASQAAAASRKSRAFLTEMRKYRVPTGSEVVAHVDSVGLIIQHPVLSLTPSLASLNDGRTDFARVGSEDVARFGARREGVFQFADPFDESPEPRQAAFARLSVDDPGADEGNHWVVVVHE